MKGRRVGPSRFGRLPIRQRDRLGASTTTHPNPWTTAKRPEGKTTTEQWTLNKVVSIVERDVGGPPAMPSLVVNNVRDGTIDQSDHNFAG